MSHLKLAKEKLSPNNLEAGLPGRKEQTDFIYTFLLERLKIRQAKSQNNPIKARHDNKTIFICGIPGTGKTATVMSALDALKKTNVKLHQFETIYINGQHLSSPDRVYSEMLYKLKKVNRNPEIAQKELESIFKPAKIRKYHIVIIDELDLLYSERRQSLFYNLFDWPTSSESSMILLTIANAMDLTERMMKSRVASRIGWDKIVFDSYTSENLAEIIEARLGKELMNKCFERTAIVIATKRIGRTTGDARRILDTCRLAIDEALALGLKQVNAAVMDKVGFQNLDANRRKYVQSCPNLHLILLKALVRESEKVGEDNVRAEGLYKEMLNVMSNHEIFRRICPGFYDFENILHFLSAIGLVHLQDSKHLMRKAVYLRDTSDIFKDLIRAEKIKA